MNTVLRSRHDCLKVIAENQDMILDQEDSLLYLEVAYQDALTKNKDLLMGLYRASMEVIRAGIAARQVECERLNAMSWETEVM